MKKIILFLIVVLILFSKSTNQSTMHGVNIIEEDYSKVSLFAVGDNLIHSTIFEAAKIDGEYNFHSIYDEVKPLLKSYDLKFINQETILGGVELGLSSYPCFNSPHELGDALIETGFNLISIANNHTLDKGEAGVLSAINYLNNKNVYYSGATISEYHSNVKIFNIKGIKFAFVAYTYGTNGIKHPDNKTYLANVYSDEVAKFDIARVRNIVDVVIVSMHWGDEYQQYPNQTQKDQAIFLAHQGVDIILGHHPHVIQPVDVITTDARETFVVYSLGNFLSDQLGIDRLIGMGVSVDIYKNNNNKKISLNNKEAVLFYRYKSSENDFFVKIFSNLNNDYLLDYLDYFEEKKSLIQTFYKEIEVK